MENVIESGKRGRRGDRNGGHEATDRGTEWRNLVSDVEDLIKKVARVDDAEIAEIRAKVEHTLAKAKGVTSEGIANIRGYARDASVATDQYVHESPWTAIGLAAAAGALIGFIAARR